MVNEEGTVVSIPEIGANDDSGRGKGERGGKEIELDNLAQMTYLFVGPGNCFSLQNLLKIKIVRCEKLEMIFSTCVLKCLAQLLHLIIDECENLKYIIEDDDVENKETSNYHMSPIRTCFPKLKTLVVRKCNKLNYVFPASICTELPELLFLMIQETCKLQKIFGGSEEIDLKVGIPNLRYELVRYIWIVSLQIVKEHSKTKGTSGGNKIGTEIQSSTSRNEIDSTIEEDSTSEDSTSPMQLVADLKQKDTKLSFEDVDLKEKTQTNNKVDPSKEESESTSRHKLTSSQELMNPQRSVAEIDTAFKPSQENNLEGSTSGKTAAEPSLSTIFETKNEPPIQSDVAPKQKGIKLSSEDGITSANAKTITSSTHSKSANSLGPTATSSLEYGDGQIVVASPPISLTKTLNDDQGDPSQIDEKEDGDDQIATAFFIATTETNNQVSRNDDALKKVNSNIKDQFPKNNEETISKSPVPSQFPLVPSKGDPSQKVEELSSSLLVMRELEQLVTKKHLDDENLCLLNDFLVNHPSVLLRDTSLSNKYKGYAYNCLAELLKFLKTHSVLEVLGSCKTEFVELLQDARSFAFDKDWFDGIERRTLFPDLQVSQDVLKNLSVSKQQVTKDVEVLRLKIEDLKHQLTSSEAVLENIIQQEAALSAPIGY
ncbi:uncharacterized protein LOC123915106 [Trifolium pratense]|uniref:uncharacterized protein LOC123915106 n=1 Tax=Trifolium pratense TaxID=57577 RepID=UPI001E696D26|nr:uncharacterized protein LOC123915106 [Trifolium pratense]